MKKISFKRVILHVIYWIVFILAYPIFYNFVVESDFGLYISQVKNVAFGSLYVISAAYFVTYYLIPELLLKKRKYLLFSIYYFGTFISAAIIDIIFFDLVVIPRDFPEHIEELHSHVFTVAYFAKSFFILHSAAFAFIAVRYFIHYIKSQLEKQKLKQQIKEAELKMLRSQLHPHFLFNTLNNIYSLSLDCSNSLVSQSIDRISTILRYSLYECNSSVVNLNNEVKIIKDYIELERIRYSNISIDTSFPNDVDDVYIIPLLLFTFVENAFKHGTSKAVKNKWIKLDLSIADEKLFFVISNSKNPKNQSDFSNYTEGVGLKNAIKRLDLFYGSENYTLVQNDNYKSFEIILTISLNQD